MITRVELDEEPFLQKGVASPYAGEAFDNAVESVMGTELEKENTQVAYWEKHENDALIPSSLGTSKVSNSNIANQEIKSPLSNDQNTPNKIATACIESMVVNIANNEKVPWKLITSIHVNNEEKRLFIPVKRHASAVGPTKV